MKIIKTLSAVMCAAMVAVTASVQTFASYAPKDLGSDLVSSGKLASGKETTVYLKEDGSYATFDIEVGKKGTLEIELTTRVMDLELNVFDSKKRSLVLSDLTNYYGNCYVSSYFVENYGVSLPADYPENATMCVGDGIYDGYHGVISFPVSKGKYTIAIKRYLFGFETNSNVTIRADYPKAVKTSASISDITIELSKGDKLSLGAELTGKGTVTWKSSKPSVASVSSAGKVTAKSKGTAVISAKCGNTTKKIKIKVS